MSRYFAIKMIMVGLLAVTFATGCGDASGEQGSVIESDGVRLLVNGGEGPNSRHAGIAGSVALTDGNCLGLKMGSETVLTVWPNGSKLNADGDGVVVPKLGTVKVGDAIETGGAYLRPPFSERSKLPEIPPECLPNKQDVAVIESEIRRSS